MIRQVIKDGAYKLVQDGTEIRIYKNDMLCCGALLKKKLRGTQLIDVLNGYKDGEGTERIKKWNQ